jgi:hypothetical protein
VIADYLNFIREKLAAVDAGAFYDKESDAARFKGAKHALIAAAEQTELTYDGGKVAYRDDLERRARTYHIRKYVEKIAVALRFADTNRDKAEATRAEFLKIIGTGFADAGDYRVEVEATAGNFLKEPGVLSIEAGTEVTLLFTGGIYTTKEVRLLPFAEPEGQILRPKEDTTNGSTAASAG